MILVPTMLWILLKSRVLDHRHYFRDCQGCQTSDTTIAAAFPEQLSSMGYPQWVKLPSKSSFIFKKENVLGIRNS